VKFSLDWLRSYVKMDEDAAQVSTWLAAAGLPVDACEAWGADHILDVDVLANRPDCMCHLGMARELAARCSRPLLHPTAEPTRGPGQADALASVQITAPDLCSRYTALVLTGVTVRPSPDWLQDRLMAIGLRPINNLVDATNFVLHEMGQPLHAFDLDRLEGGGIIVRRAAAGEMLVTLDEEKRTLQPDDLVIADGGQALALAGIMGGVDSEITPQTTRVLIESAHFEPAAIRRTGRRLGLHTDASHRFERGTDPGNTLTAALRAAALMLESCGGSLAAGELDIQPRPPVPLQLALARRRLEGLLGMEVDHEMAAGALSPLGFVTGQAGEDQDRLMVQVPTWRVDVTEEVDLIEEVGRMLGYDRIPATVPSFPSTTAGAPCPTAAPDRARTFMAAAGFNETIHFPMTARGAQEMFLFPAVAGDCLVSLDNPMNRQMNTLRTSLLPGLLTSVAHNRNRGMEEVQLFEVGRVFREKAPVGGVEGDLPLPEERTLVAAIAGGSPDPAFWGQRRPPLDFFDLKGVLEALARRATPQGLTLQRPEDQDRPAFLAPGEAAIIQLEGVCAGWIGRLDGPGLAAWDLPDHLLAFELDMTSSPVDRPRATYEALPRQPSADRDLAIILSEEVGYHDVEELLYRHGGDLLESVNLFDRYQGDPIPSGRVSLAVRLVFRAPDRTLTAPEVQQVVAGMVVALRSHLDGEIREA
jgi:phenylalanyl-tRNA synthetase beta chain